MLKMRETKGKWKNSVSDNITLYWEVCPNSKCENSDHMLHYPHHMTTPHCPTCNENLPGASNNVMCGPANRVIFHLS